jgi:hypothetical protein
MMGVKAEMCEGRCVERRWATGALFGKGFALARNKRGEWFGLSGLVRSCHQQKIKKTREGRKNRKSPRKQERTRQDEID